MLNLSNFLRCHIFKYNMAFMFKKFYHTSEKMETYYFSDQAQSLTLWAEPEIFCHKVEECLEFFFFPLLLFNIL